jgi:hypothetical protein
MVFAIGFLVLVVGGWLWSKYGEVVELMFDPGLVSIEV